jgi:hypothetical protein
MKAILRPSGGHILDVESIELADSFLSFAKNVHMRKGFPSRLAGRRIAYPVDAGAAPTDPMHLLNLNLNSFNWWMLFGNQDIYAVEGNNFYDISIPGQNSIANPYEWSSTLLNGIPVFSNGKDAPHYWNGDGNDVAVEIPGWPATTSCKFIVAFRFHLFALNIDGPGGVIDNAIMWSDAAEPGTLPASWTAAPSNEAGSGFLADTEGRCIAGLPLATQLMIYKPNSVYAAEYVGTPDVFSIRPVVRSIGLLSPHALRAVGTQHAVVGNDDVVLTDGVNVRSIADSRIKQYLKNSIDENNALNTFIVYDQNQKELWVCAPEPGSQYATVAHIWDQARDNWVTKDLNNVRHATIGYATDQAPSDIWDDDSQAWDDDFGPWNAASVGAISKVVTAEDTLMYVEDVPADTIIDATITRTDLTFGDSDVRKVTSRVYLEGSGALSGLYVRLGARNSTNDAIAWGTYVLYQSGGIPFEVAGTLISIEVANNTTANPWTVTRITIEAEPDGAY